MVERLENTCAYLQILLIVIVRTEEAVQAELACSCFVLPRLVPMRKLQSAYGGYAICLR